MIRKNENLERRVAANNQNKYERFRKKQHRIEYNITQDITRKIKTGKK